jgi:hypothetical protein
LLFADRRALYPKLFAVVAQMRSAITGGRPIPVETNPQRRGATLRPPTLGDLTPELEMLGWQAVRRSATRLRWSAEAYNQALAASDPLDPADDSVQQRHAGAWLVLAGRALRVPVASASGALSRTTTVGCRRVCPAASA